MLTSVRKSLIDVAKGDLPGHPFRGNQCVDEDWQPQPGDPCESGERVTAPTKTLPTLTNARTYLRELGDDLITSFEPYEEGDHSIEGWAFRRLSRNRRGRGGSRPASSVSDYQEAAIAVSYREDDPEYAAEIASSLVVIFRRDAKIMNTWSEGFASWAEAGGSPNGRFDADRSAELADLWEQNATRVNELADELTSDYLTTP